MRGKNSANLSKFWILGALCTTPAPIMVKFGVQEWTLLQLDWTELVVCNPGRVQNLFSLIPSRRYEWLSTLQHVTVTLNAAYSSVWQLSLLLRYVFVGESAADADTWSVCVSHFSCYTRAALPVATCRQSLYLHKPAIVIVMSFSLRRLAPMALAAPVPLWRHSHCDVIRYWAGHAHRYGHTNVHTYVWTPYHV